MTSRKALLEREQDEKLRPYESKDYTHLLGMQEFSEKLLNTHFKLYQGYVSNTNTALEMIQTYLKEGKEKSPEFSELKRRLGWEFNGMRLHEYYFDNLGGKKQLDLSDPLGRALQSQYGSYDVWRRDFTATGAMRGIGWVILYQDPQTNRLINAWIEEHNTNHLAGGQPILVLDVFEHAYLTDYGTEKGKYMEAFFKNINWETVSGRYVGSPIPSLTLA